MNIEPSKFAAAVAGAAPLLDGPEDTPYRDEIFIVYTRRIIEGMGGTGPNLDACAEEIYREWAACHHFELYDDVPDTLREIAAMGIRVGLISNSHRSLSAFASHFELDGLIAATLSSPDHGYMKPHPSIFTAALQLLDVRAGEALMVGDSPKHDVEGAIRAGMRGVLLRRGDTPTAGAEDHGVPIIRTLRELPALLTRQRDGILPNTRPTLT